LVEKKGKNIPSLPPATAATASCLATRCGRVFRFILRFRTADQSGWVGVGPVLRPKTGGGFASWIIENRMTPATENSEAPWLGSKIPVNVVGHNQPLGEKVRMGEMASVTSHYDIQLMIS